MIKKDKSENNGEEKELGFLDDTSPDEMEDDVCNKRMTRMKKWGEKKVKFLDDTSPEEMEEDVSDKKNDKSENNDERKEAECLDDTSPDEMEE